MKPGGFVESFAFGGGVPEDLQAGLRCVIFIVYRGSMTVEQ